MYELNEPIEVKKNHSEVVLSLFFTHINYGFLSEERAVESVSQIEKTMNGQDSNRQEFERYYSEFVKTEYMSYDKIAPDTALEIHQFFNKSHIRATGDKTPVLTFEYNKNTGVWKKYSQFSYGFQCVFGDRNTSLCPYCKHSLHQIRDTKLEVREYKATRSHYEYNLQVEVFQGNRSLSYIIARDQINLPNIYSLVRSDQNLWVNEHNETTGCSSTFPTEEDFFNQPNKCQKPLHHCTSYGSLLKPDWEIHEFVEKNNSIHMKFDHNISVPVGIDISQLKFIQPKIELSDILYQIDSEFFATLHINITNYGNANGTVALSTKCNNVFPRTEVNQLHLPFDDTIWYTHTIFSTNETGNSEFNCEFFAEILNAKKYWHHEVLSDRKYVQEPLHSGLFKDICQREEFKTAKPVFQRRNITRNFDSFLEVQISHMYSWFSKYTVTLNCSDKQAISLFHHVEKEENHSLFFNLNMFDRGTYECSLLVKMNFSYGCQRSFKESFPLNMTNNFPSQKQYQVSREKNSNRSSLSILISVFISIIVFRFTVSIVGNILFPK